MLSKIFILTTLIFSIVFGRINYDKSLSFLVDDTQQTTDIPCLCINNELCDIESKTCRLTHSHHMCYESWKQSVNKNEIRVTAGYRNIHFI